MKRKIISIVLLCSMFLSGCGNSDNTKSKLEEPDTLQEDSERIPDIREICWGDSMDDVRRIEGKPVDQGDDGLLYNVKLCGYDATLLYSFDDDYGVYMAMYTVEGDRGTIELSKFKKICEKISELYGESEITKVELSSLYKYCDNDGEALEMGYIMMGCNWNLNNTEVQSIITRFDTSKKVCSAFTFSDNRYVEPEEENGF